MARRLARALLALAALAAMTQIALFVAQQAGWRPTPTGGWYARHVAAPLARVLERRFPRAAIDDWSAIEGAIAPGGAPGRIAEIEALGKAHSGLRLLVSGPNDFERAMIARWEPQLRARLVVEDRSLPGASNTYDNARNSFALLRPKPGERWALVTSSVHMPRAMGAFRMAGFDVLPWPVYDLTGHPESVTYLAHHEWLGLILYRLSGRSDAFLPRPSR